MNTTIELNNVTWRREQKTVLTGVDWTVQQGEHWAVLGLNGSGKTTILNMINGYIWPTSGTVSVLGNLFGRVDLRELRKSIGWVSSSLQERIRPSESTLDVVISGKHASIGLYQKVDEADQEQAEQLMKDFHCIHLLGRTYETCSQGEKQKLLIARALMASPRLLILDEACNGLDFLSRKRCCRVSLHWHQNPMHRLCCSLRIILKRFCRFSRTPCSFARAVYLARGLPRIC